MPDEFARRIGVLGADGRLGRELLGAMSSAGMASSECVPLANADELERETLGTAGLDAVVSGLTAGALPAVIAVLGDTPLLVIDAAGNSVGGDSHRVWDVDVAEEGAAGARVLTLPRWASTQIVRVVRPLLPGVAGIDRVAVQAAQHGVEAEIDERLVPREVRELLDAEVRVGYQVGPVPDEGQEVQQVATIEHALVGTVIDALAGAGGVQLRQGWEGGGQQARVAARETGEVIVTRVHEDSSELGSVQVEWTAAAAHRGAAIQAVRVLQRLLEAR